MSSIKNLKGLGKVVWITTVIGTCSGTHCESEREKKNPLWSIAFDVVNKNLNNGAHDFYYIDKKKK